MTAKMYYSNECAKYPNKQINLIGVPFNHLKARYTYTASTAENGDGYVLVQGLSGNKIVKSLKLTCSAITAAADNDVAICKHGTMEPITVVTGKTNLLVDGQTMASALTGSEVLGANISNFDFAGSLEDLTGVKNETFDIVLLVKTKGTANGTFSVDIDTADNL